MVLEEQQDRKMYRHGLAEKGFSTFAKPAGWRWHFRPGGETAYDDIATSWRHSHGRCTENVTCSIDGGAVKNNNEYFKYFIYLLIDYSPYSPVVRHIPMV